MERKGTSACRLRFSPSLPPRCTALPWRPEAASSGLGEAVPSPRRGRADVAGMLGDGFRGSSDKGLGKLVELAM